MITVVHFTSSLARGGAEAILSSLVKGLNGSFYQVVLYIHDGPHRKDIEQLGIECIQIRGLITTYDPWFFIRLYKVLKRIKPSILHTLLWSASVSGRLVGSLLRIKIVTMYHGNVDQNGRLRNFFDQHTLSLSHINAAVSLGVSKSVKTLYSPAQLHVIHNGIDCDAMPVIIKKRSDIGIDSAAFVVGSVGRLVTLKRFDIFIQTILLLQQKLENVHACIVGVGPELESLQKLTRLYGIENRVIFLIDVPAVDYYHLFDCFVLASEREGISIALLEAMRAKRVVIVVSPDNNHPVIKHKYNGLVVHNADAYQLMNAIILIKEQKKEAVVWAFNGYNTVKNCFNRNVMINKYRRIFHAVLS